jgi:hypothetical protein
MPAITQEVVSGGAVFAYWGSTGQRWVAMPFTLPVSGATTILGFAYEVNTFIPQVVSESTDPSVPSVFDGDQIKVVVVPPSEVNARVDWTDHDEVMDLLDR